jgi:hypothetical protein
MAALLAEKGGFVFQDQEIKLCDSKVHKIGKGIVAGRRPFKSARLPFLHIYI